MADPAAGTTIFGVSKTTIAGVLSFVITTLTVLTAFQVPSALQSPGSSHVFLILTTVAAIILALCRAWVGMLQGDAPPPPPPPPPPATDALGKAEPSTGGSK